MQSSPARDALLHYFPVRQGKMAGQMLVEYTVAISAHFAPEFSRDPY
jgi:hypothetical protein